MKKQIILTGIRPSASLTIANLIGSVYPILELQRDQKEKNDILVFVATIHGITDHDPAEVVPNIEEVVRDYLALGLDPNRIIIFDQRFIRREVAIMKLYLERHATISRMLRVPTLKDKLRKGQQEEQASVLLANYPIMMTADIVLQDATMVPVGKDQYPHIEFAREIVATFNSRYGESVLTMPEIMNRGEPVNILSLRGDGKMSKTNPNNALFLTDKKEIVYKKIQSAETAFPGSMSEKLSNLVYVGKLVAPDSSNEFDKIIAGHMKGEKVMGVFKKFLAEKTIAFLIEFQKERSKISPQAVNKILRHGGEIAMERANNVLDRVETALKIK